MLVEKPIEKLKAKDHLSVLRGCSSSLLFLAEQTEAFLLLLLSLPRTWFWGQSQSRRHRLSAAQWRRVGATAVVPRGSVQDCLDPGAHLLLQGHHISKDSINNWETCCHSKRTSSLAWNKYSFPSVSLKEIWTTNTLPWQPHYLQAGHMMVSPEFKDVFFLLVVWGYVTGRLL